MRNIRTLALLGAVTTAMLSAGPALAATCAPISVSAPPATLSYDPIKAVAATTTTFTIAIGTKISTNTANYRLIFTDSTTNATLRIGSNGPRYSILNSASQRVSFPSGTTAASQTGVNLLPATTTSVTYTVSLPVNTTTDFTGGTPYSDNIGYALQCYRSNGNTNGLPDSSASLTTLNANITNVLSVVTASPQTLDFGNFTSTSQTLQVGLKSTNSINVSVSTANGSTMALAGATAPFNTSNSIPYTMSFNGAALSGSATNNVSRASVTGSTYPFLLSLTGGVPSGKFSGTYSDVITLTFTPGV